MSASSSFSKISDDEKKSSTPTESKQVHVTLLGDSTIDNRVWVDGLYKSYFRTKLRISRDTPEVRVRKSHRTFCKPSLSVVENVMDLLPDNYEVHDYTNDGFTSQDCLLGQHKDKVFPGGLFSLFPHQLFAPLVAGKESIESSQYIILSIGGNDFREFLLRAKEYQAQDRKDYITRHFPIMLEVLVRNYQQIIEKIRTINRDAKLILMTQYYPSASQKDLNIYEFMQELGEILEIDEPDHNPMTVINEIMRQTYTKILAVLPPSNIVVADITSSLDPYNNDNHVYQIEPSAVGGNKIAQMLKYIMTSSKIVPGHVYRFSPSFTTAVDKDNYVESQPFAQWRPAHPYYIREGFTTKEDRIFRERKLEIAEGADLLSYLDKAIRRHATSGRLYKQGLKVHELATKLLSDKNNQENIKAWKISVTLATNALNHENDPIAIRLLMDNATYSAVGKSDGWQQFKRALSMLAGLAIIGLGLLGIPFTGGYSLIGMYAAGGILSLRSATLFYRNRQKSLSKELSLLADECDVGPRSSRVKV